MAVTTDSEKPADEKYIKMLKLMIDEPTNYNKIMETAAYSGHIEIVKLMLEKGAKNYDCVMTNAAYSGHIDIVKLMLEKGAKNYDDVIRTAAYCGHIEIVKLMLEKGAKNYDWAMSWAASCGHTEIVNYLQEHQKNQKVECSKDAEIILLKKEIESFKLKLNKIQEIII